MSPDKESDVVSGMLEIMGILVTPTQKPSVGRIVHYVEDGQCRAAIIIGTDRMGGTQDLSVFTEFGFLIRLEVEESSIKEESYWHWPERVE